MQVFFFYLNYYIEVVEETIYFSRKRKIVDDIIDFKGIICHWIHKKINLKYIYGVLSIIKKIINILNSNPIIKFDSNSECKKL